MNLDRLRPRTPRSSLLVAVIALGVATLLLVGGRGTLAFWTDSATVGGATITAGTLDLTVDGAQGNPTASATANLALAGMVPGESVASNVVLANAGDVGFNWRASAATGGDLGPTLAVEVYLGSASGDDTTYPRTETCSGTAVTLGSTSTRLNRGQNATVCVKVTLPVDAANSFQSRTTGSATVTFDATQVGS